MVILPALRRDDGSIDEQKKWRESNEKVGDMGVDMGRGAVDCRRDIRDAVVHGGDMMRLMLGDYGISVEMKDTFGKRPGLYVVNKNCSMKVGNFGSEEKARIFEGYLKHLVGLDGPDELWKGWDDADD